MKSLFGFGLKVYLDLRASFIYRWSNGPDNCRQTLLHRAIDENNESVACFLIRRYIKSVFFLNNIFHLI